MRILIAEDDPVSGRRLEAMLAQWGYEIVAVQDGIEALEQLRRPGAPTLALLDWMMPGMDGIEVCRKVRSENKGEYVYIVLLTAKGNKDDLVRGMEAGADDYVVKPFDSHELKVRLHAGTRIIDLQRQLIEAREALRSQATHDALTGLWNRRAIFDLLARETARTKRGGKPFSVILADIDHFKRVNDTYGHVAGDAVLREVAERMRAAVRPYDDVGRYGGEEFLAILTECSQAEAANVAERMRAQIAGEPVAIPQGTISVTISLGVATAAAPQDADGTATVRSADAALYRAKEAGRNRVQVTAENTCRPAGSSDRVS